MNDFPIINKNQNLSLAVKVIILVKSDDANIVNPNLSGPPLAIELIQVYVVPLSSAKYISFVVLATILVKSVRSR